MGLIWKKQTTNIRSKSVYLLSLYLVLCIWYQLVFYIVSLNDTPHIVNRDFIKQQTELTYHGYGAQYYLNLPEEFRNSASLFVKMQQFPNHANNICVITINKFNASVPVLEYDINALERHVDYEICQWLINDNFIKFVELMQYPDHSSAMFDGHPVFLKKNTLFDIGKIPDHGGVLLLMTYILSMARCLFFTRMLTYEEENKSLDMLRRTRDGIYGNTIVLVMWFILFEAIFGLMCLFAVVFNPSIWKYKELWFNVYAITIYTYLLYACVCCILRRFSHVLCAVVIGEICSFLMSLYGLVDYVPLPQAYTYILMSRYHEHVFRTITDSTTPYFLVALPSLLCGILACVIFLLLADNVVLSKLLGDVLVGEGNIIIKLRRPGLKKPCATPMNIKQSYLLTGFNGSGKTYFLRSVAGITSDYKIKFQRNDRKVKTIPRRELRRKIAFCPAQTEMCWGIFEYATPRQHIEWCAQLRGFTQTQAAILANDFLEQCPDLRADTTSGFCWKNASPGLVRILQLMMTFGKL